MPIDLQVYHILLTSGEQCLSCSKLHLLYNSSYWFHFRFLFGDKICYCDLSLFHIIHATESQFPDAFKAADYIPLLKSFKERIASRPRIADYLRSERWRGFAGDSMMWLVCLLWTVICGRLEKVNKNIRKKGLKYYVLFRKEKHYMK